MKNYIHSRVKLCAIESARTASRWEEVIPTASRLLSLVDGGTFEVLDIQPFAGSTSSTSTPPAAFGWTKLTRESAVPRRGVS